MADSFTANHVRVVLGLPVAMLDETVPFTQNQVRSLLGLVGGVLDQSASVVGLFIVLILWSINLPLRLLNKLF